MKHIFAKLTVVALILTATVAVAQNQMATNTTGISWVGAGGTSNALSTAYTEVKNHQEGFIQWRQVWSATNALAAGNTSTTVIGGSEVPSNFVAIASVVRPVPVTTGTLTYDIGTNIYFGSCRYFAILSQTSTATNSTVTNMSVNNELGKITWQFKDKRNGL